jgi:hypothetical protein
MVPGKPGDPFVNVVSLPGGKLLQRRVIDAERALQVARTLESITAITICLR